MTPNEGLEGGNPGGFEERLSFGPKTYSAFRNGVPSSRVGLTT